MSWQSQVPSPFRKVPQAPHTAPLGGPVWEIRSPLWPLILLILWLSAAFSREMETEDQ